MADQFFIGKTFDHNFKFKQEDVDNFAKASGDFNPMHLDEEFAKTTIFGRRIVHGFLGGSVFSKIFGTVYPGHGTIYLNQNMVFYKPMFCETDYIAKFTIIKLVLEKNRAIVKTEILDTAGTLIIGGDALIQHKDIK